MTNMELIERGLTERHEYGGKDEFIDAVYELFDEFRRYYSAGEWPRLDMCERMYRGDHWHDIEQNNEQDPRPTTPILFSTIENIRADLTDEYPEAIIKPEDNANELLAKIVTELVGQSVEACDYDKEYDDLTHDLLVGGWMVQEVGYDTSLNSGLGGAFIRHVSNKNILFDPCSANIQEGRAVFKFDILPKEWLRQHYKEAYPHISADHDKYSLMHDMGGYDKDECIALIEGWFRFYDLEEECYRVHMIKLAGGCLLENSCDVKPEGYFCHGQYPFIVTALYDQRGLALGIGIVDMFKNAQQYSDKLDQIILKNALMAGHNRFLVMEDSVDVDDLRDYSKDVITTNAPPGSVMSWLQDRPLPSHIVAYMRQMRESIKEESGTNDFARGNTVSGVTAASAIMALQEMGSKRSRMEARRVHYGFKQAVRMMIEVIREFDNYPRRIAITINGEPQEIMVSAKTLAQLGGKAVCPEGEQQSPLPIEFSVSIKAARATRFTRISNNQMVLEFCEMLKGKVDPAVLMEAMDFDGQELILEKLRAASNSETARLKEELEGAQSLLAQLQSAAADMKQENEALRAYLVSAKKVIGGA